MSRFYSSVLDIPSSYGQVKTFLITQKKKPFWKTVPFSTERALFWRPWGTKTKQCTKTQLCPTVLRTINGAPRALFWCHLFFGVSTTQTMVTQVVTVYTKTKDGSWNWGRSAHKSTEIIGQKHKDTLTCPQCLQKNNRKYGTQFISIRLPDRSHGPT